jgi:Glycosyltransferase family 87
VINTSRGRGWSDFFGRDLPHAFVPWVLARVCVLGALAVVRSGLSDAHLRRPVAATQGLFAWDAAFYRVIAESGYSPSRDRLRFFPLVPLLSRWLGVVMFDHTAAALLVVASVSALIFGALLYSLTMRETGDPKLAQRAAWFAAVFPPAMVLVLGYAEATLMALSVGMFIALRSRRWALAALLGVLAGLCRPIAVLLVIPVVIEAARQWRRIPRAERITRGAAVISPLVGTGIFLAWAGGVYGDWLEPLRQQTSKRLRGGFENPGTRVGHAFGDLFGNKFGSGLHVMWALLFIVVIVVLARRMPSSYTAYAAATVLVGLSAHNLDSFERYAMSAFPLALGVALITGPEEVEKAALVVAAAGLVGYATLAFLGVYVP